MIFYSCKDMLINMQDPIITNYFTFGIQPIQGIQDPSKASILQPNSTVQQVFAFVEQYTSPSDISL